MAADFLPPAEDFSLQSACFALSISNLSCVKRPSPQAISNICSTTLATVVEQPLPTKRAASSGSDGIDPCCQHDQSNRQYAPSSSSVIIWTR
jgi:hypothetical protein